MGKSLAKRKATWYLYHKDDLLVHTGIVSDTPILDYWVKSNKFESENVLIEYSFADRLFGVRYTKIPGEKLVEFLTDCKKFTSDEEWLAAHKNILGESAATVKPTAFDSCRWLARWLNHDCWKLREDTWYSICRLVKLYKTDGEDLLPRFYTKVAPIDPEERLLKAVFGEEDDED